MMDKSLLDHDYRRWKVLNSEYLHQQPWLTVRRDTVQLPDGQINPEFYILEYPDWVNVIPVTNNGRIVLVRQYRHGIRQTRLELCAGVVEKGEDPVVGARRELLEETGYSGGEWEKIMTISPNASVNSNYTHCYVAKGVEKVASQHLDTTEDIEVVLLEQDEVFDLLQRGEFMQALMVAPLWKYFYNLGRR